MNAEYQERIVECLKATLRRLDALRETIQDVVYENNPGMFSLALDQTALHIYHASDYLDMVLRNIELYDISPKEYANEE